MSRIAVFCFARPTFDTAFAAEKAAAAVATLRAMGAEIVGDDALLMDAEAVEARLSAVADEEALSGVLIVQASFCDAAMARRIGETLSAPIAIWAFPEPRSGGRLRLNSFCGLNLAAHALGKIGRPPAWFYAPETERPDLAALFGRATPPSRSRAPVRGGEAVVALRQASGRYGLIGEHPAGFDTCAFDEVDVARRFGVAVERMAVSDLFDAARAQAPERAAALVAETAERLDGLSELEAEPVEKSLRAYGAMRDWIDAKDLRGVAVRCWPETFTEYGCAVCGAMARLNGEGRPASCEADLLGSVGSRLLQELSGGPSLLVDIVDLDAADDTGVLWHCGLAPLAFCDPEARPEAALHSNRVKPLLHQFPMKPGRVTVARISQARGAIKLVIGSGEMLRRPMAFTGTSGVIRFDAGAEAVRARLLDEALEHHLSITYGAVKPGLEAAATAWGLDVVDLDEAAP